MGAMKLCGYQARPAAPAPEGDVRHGEHVGQRQDGGGVGPAPVDRKHDGFRPCQGRAGAAQRMALEDIASGVSTDHRSGAMRLPGSAS